jgi:hypothetical protein
VAKKWTDALAYANDLTLCGYSDWRLPNINEMLSLINAGAPNPSVWLASQGFTNVQSRWCWSSTTQLEQYAGSDAWMVSMEDGWVMNWEKSLTMCVLPVRGGLTGLGPAAVWKTGQTTCHDEYANQIACAGTGQDGDIQAGVAWPSPRFNDHGDGAVTDNLTGLMWTKDACAPGPSECTPGCNPAQKMRWQTAFEYVKCLNAGEGYLGYTDWRLPNRTELRSLIDYSRAYPILQTGHPFTNPFSDWYLSSTTCATTEFTGNSWNMAMYNGDLPSQYKGAGIWPWPVRGHSSPYKPTLTISKPGAGQGTVTSSPLGINCGSTCSAKFTQDAAVTLTAASATGSVFSGWSGACSGTGPCKVTMKDNTAISANFTSNFYLSILKTGNGTVKSAPAGVNCGTVCSTYYAPGTVVTLTATPAPGQLFAGWSGGGCSGTAMTCVITVNGNTTISADFAPQILTVTGVVSGTYGTVSPATQKVSYGASATVTYTPKSGYGIATLTDTGKLVPIVNPYVISSVTSNHTVAASFASSLPLNLRMVGIGSGTVTSSPAGMNCTAACSASFPANTVVTLTATPDGVKSTFTGWSGACTGTGTCQLTMDSVKDVTATFSKPVLLGPVYTVNASVSGIHGTVSPLTQKISVSQPASISISPDKGYHIASIIDNGQSMPVANPYLIGSVTADHAVTVAFSNFYILNTSKSGSGTGNTITSPKGIACGATCQYYKPGTKVTLIAKPDRKSTFTGWTGACTGTDPCKVTMNSDVTTGAIFAGESHLTVNPESKTYGEVKINKTKFALFTVKNTGKKDVAISSISIQGTDPDQFTLHSNRCINMTLKTNRTCTASVLFAPTAPGAMEADLVITSDDTIHPVLTVPLSGIGESLN